MLEATENKSEVALEFNSEQDFSAALKIIFDYWIPHVLVGGRTIILSREKANLFNNLKFKQTDVLSATELPPEEIAELRRENLSFQDY